MQLIAIATGLPPRIDGVGDYALSLACLIRKELGIDTHFIVGDPHWDGPQSVEGFGVTRLQDRSRSGLVSLLETKLQNTASVLLHYSGYGYATRGCPAWLVDGLEQWRRQSDDRRLITVFHELYATGPVWTSAFWLSRLQKNLAARLARLSDHYITSSNNYAETICRWSDGKHTEAQSLPVFSSVGEPRAVLPLSERSRKLVVFGTRGRRVEVYKRSASDLNRICRRLGIEEILDIGRPVELDVSQIIDVPVRICGEMAGHEVSNMLSDAVAGVIDYPASILGKSTIFAAYCAHRIIPIVATYGDSTPSDRLEPGTHYWLSDAEPEKVSLATGQVVADNAYDWYQAHSLSVHAKSLATFLTANGHHENLNSVYAKS